MYLYVSFKGLLRTCVFHFWKEISSTDSQLQEQNVMSDHPEICFI